MTLELKKFTINLKSLDQDIPDPIVAGAGDANGRTLSIIFTEEAAAQFSPNTKVYLSWKHENNICGLNVFTKVSDEPLIWEIQYPREMLWEGNVIACIKLVDEINIVQSVNFIIHVVADPEDGSTFVESDYYTEFQKAILDLNNLRIEHTEIFNRMVETFNQMVDTFNTMADSVNKLLAEENEKDSSENANNEENTSQIENEEQKEEEEING